MWWECVCLSVIYLGKRNLLLSSFLALLYHVGISFSLSLRMMGLFGGVMTSFFHLKVRMAHINHYLVELGMNHLQAAWAMWQAVAWVPCSAELWACVHCSLLWAHSSPSLGDLETEGETLLETKSPWHAGLHLSIWTFPHNPDREEYWLSWDTNAGKTAGFRGSRRGPRHPARCQFFCLYLWQIQDPSYIPAL